MKRLSLPGVLVAALTLGLCGSQAQSWPQHASLALPLSLAPWDPATVPDEADEALLALVTNHTDRWSAALSPAGSPAERRAAREALAQDIEIFLLQFPHSRAELGLRLTLGTYYQRQARWSLALPHLEITWALAQTTVSPDQARFADRAQVALGLALLELGRGAALDALLRQTQRRPAPSPGWAAVWRALRESWAEMREDPSLGSLLCGARALNSLGIALGGSEPSVREVLQDATSLDAQGFTLGRLQQIGQRHGLALQSAVRSPGALWVTPALVHWKEDLWRTVLAVQGPGFWIEDPTRGRIWMSAEHLDQEVSGYCLVPSGALPPGWRAATASEAGEVVGRSYAVLPHDAEDEQCEGGCADECPPGHGGPGFSGGPGRGGGGAGMPSGGGSEPMGTGGSIDGAPASCACTAPPCNCPTGLPRWRVSEPFINVWLEDEPWGYPAPRGPAPRLGLSHKLRDQAVVDGYPWVDPWEPLCTWQDQGEYPPMGSSFGFGWASRWFSYLCHYEEGDEQWGIPDRVVVRTAGRGFIDVSLLPGEEASDPAYSSHAVVKRLRDEQGAQIGWEVEYPGGERYQYTEAATSTWLGTRYFLTHYLDRAGQALQFEYDQLQTTCEQYDTQTIVRWSGLRDAVGSLSTLAYTNLTYPTLITSITDPDGRIARFAYDADGYLTNITDVVGIEAGFEYVEVDPTFPHMLWRMTTPYGQTSFHITERWIDPSDVERFRTESAVYATHRIDYPDSTHVEQVYTNGAGVMLLDRTGSRDRLGNWTRFEYNGLRQVTRILDPLLRETRYTYCGCGGPENVTRAYGTPVAQTTQYQYDFAARLTRTTGPDGTSITNFFDALGRLAIIGQTVGTATNYYDNLGRLWLAENAAGVVSETAYDLEDRVLSHTDANGVTVTNAYDALGRPTLRVTPASGGIETWGYTSGVGGPTSYANQVNTSTLYAYDTAGNLTNVAYPAGTASITNWFDALDRLTNRLDGLGATVYQYAMPGSGQQTFSENGPWTGDTDLVTVTNRYGRRAGITIKQPTGQFVVTNAWDAAGRWKVVGGTPGTFTYAYPATTPGSPASSQPASVTVPGGGYVTNAFDALARLTRTELRTSGGTILNAHGYQYNAANQRTLLGRTNSAVSAWNGYVTGTYDAAGQLTQAWTYQPNGTAVNTEKWSYGYDAAQNLAKRTNNLSVETFTVNALNQLQSIPDSTPTYDRRGNLVSRYFPANNWAYWYYTYDHENQLTRVATDTTNTLAAYRFRVDFAYDGQGRLRVKKDYVWGTGDWYLSAETRYLYDGLLSVQERNGSNTPTVTYTRGRDLSGTLAGAGGIGGLLARSHGYSAGNWSYHNAYHADGNGNVTALVNSGGTLQASYKYDPYGRWLAQNGTLASANVMRFSSKPWVAFAGSATSGLYYYGYRFYDPYLQRWVHRDPQQVAEFLPEGSNLYRYAAGDPVRYWDAVGLEAGYEYPNPGRMTPPPVDGLICRVADWIDAIDSCGDRVLGETQSLGGTDKLRHCVASCRIARECAPGPLGTLAAWVGGDVMRDPFWSAHDEDSIGDRWANSIGRGFRTANGSCRLLCTMAEQDGRLRLPPRSVISAPLRWPSSKL